MKPTLPIFIVAGILVWIKFSATGQRETSFRPRWEVMSDSDVQVKGWLIRPYYTPRGDTGLALDGGEIPLLGDRVPILSYGAKEKQGLYLCMRMDWRDEKSLRLLKSLHELYMDATLAKGLPPLELVLLFSGRDEEARRIEKIVYRVYLLCSDMKTFPAVTEALYAGKNDGSYDTLIALIEETEPELVERVKVADQWEKLPEEFVMAAAVAQREKNSLLVKNGELPQLCSMNAMFFADSKREVLTDFLVESMKYQTEYLSSELGKKPIAPDFGCIGNNTGRKRRAWKAEVVTEFPEVYAPRETEPPPPFSVPKSN